MTNKTFTQQLRLRAQEQRSLMEHGLLPDFLTGANSWIASNTWVKIGVISFGVSLGFFVVFFRSLYTLGLWLI